MSKERVLDIGIGTSNHLGIYTKPEFCVTGIDRRADVVSRTRSSMNGEFVMGDAEQLPFQRATFDRVYALMTLEHVADPKAVLRESHRVLTPKGRLILDVPHPRYEAVMSRISGPAYSHQLHEHVFMPSEIKALVEISGFHVTECSPRMWHAAIGFSAKWLRTRLKGRLQFDQDTGELLDAQKGSRNSHPQSALLDLAKRLLWYSENRDASPKRYKLLSPLRIMNHVYPWATYIEAIKI